MGRLRNFRTWPQDKVSKLDVAGKTVGAGKRSPGVEPRRSQENASRNVEERRFSAA
jgi:hypothetical protein